MDSAYDRTPVLIASSPSIDAEVRSFAGLSCLICLPLAIAGLLDGKPSGLCFLLVPAAALAFGRWMEYVTPEHAAVLYPDRFEIPSHPDKPLVVPWSDVISIRWPKTRGEHVRVQLATKKDAAQSRRRIFVDLQDVSPRDQLVLIDYLHRAGGAVEQENWGAFCLKRAIPLAETLEERNDAGAAARSAIRGWLRPIEQYPFFAGLFSPIVLPILLRKLISRAACWTLAAIIAASACINIRLVWGRWLPQFSELCLGAATACFLLGVFAPSNRSLKKEPSASLLSVIGWWVLALIVCPFVANAAVIGWIPWKFGLWAVLTGFAALHGPMIQIYKEQQRRNKKSESLHAAAIRRWEVYQTTGSLPPARDEAQVASHEHDAAE